MHFADRRGQLFFRLLAAFSFVLVAWGLLHSSLNDLLVDFLRIHQPAAAACLFAVLLLHAVIISYLHFFIPGYNAANLGFVRSMLLDFFLQNSSPPL